MMHKITNAVYDNKWLKRKDTRLIEPTNQNTIKLPKVVDPANRKRYHKTLGTNLTCPN